MSESHSGWLTWLIFLKTTDCCGSVLLVMLVMVLKGGQRRTSTVVISHSECVSSAFPHTLRATSSVNTLLRAPRCLRQQTKEQNMLRLHVGRPQKFHVDPHVGRPKSGPPAAFITQCWTKCVATMKRGAPVGGSSRTHRLPSARLVSASAEQAHTGTSQVSCENKGWLFGLADF